MTAATVGNNICRGECFGFGADPENPLRLYAACGTRFYRSDDRGLSWSHVSNLDAPAYSLEVLETGTVLVGPNWGGYDDELQDGLFESTDGGLNWVNLEFGTPQSGILVWDIEHDSTNNILYACTEIYDHPTPYNPPFFRSTDGGQSWQDISGILPWHATRVQVHPESYDVYALTEGAGLYWSQDFGSTWEYRNNYFYLNLLIDERHPNQFYGGNHTYGGRSGGVYFSTDVAQTFDFVGLEGHIVGSFALIGTGPRLLAAGYGTGLFSAVVPAAVVPIFSDGFENPENIITVLEDSSNDVGRTSSIAIGNDGFAVISYVDFDLDPNSGALKVAKCNNVLCTTATISIVDDASTVFFTSIAVDEDGLPVISYEDRTTNALKVSKCNDAACTGDDETISTVDDPENNVGLYNSIAIGADGLPVISYRDHTAGKLKVAKCNDAACSGGDESINHH